MHHTDLSDAAVHFGNRNAYWISGVGIVAALLIGFTTLVFPQVAGAFWPFTPSPAAASGSNAPILHDSSIELLRAAVNPDPNPTKGGNVIAMTGGTALVANSGPDGTIADIEPTQSNGRISVYVVREGDTLSEIADMYGVSVSTIAWANNISAKARVAPGTTLVVLPISGVQVTVAKGDTLTTLAKKYSSDPDEIAAYNGLDAASGLDIGDVLIIPGGEFTGPITVPGKAVKAVKKVVGGIRVRSGGGLTSIQTNPYRGGSGAALPGFFRNPLPGGVMTQLIHGWNGIDIGAHTGTPIYAAAEGTVIVSRSGGWNGGYGSYVVIDHGNGTQTLYSHMSRVAASVGDSVGQGEVIGYVGATGDATGPHLHYEVRGAANNCRNSTLGSACSSQ